MYQSHLITPKSIFVSFSDGKVIIGSDSPKFQEIREMLLKMDFTNTRLLNLINRDRILKAKRKPIFTIKGGKYYHNSELIPASIGKMILQFEESELPYEPILNFWLRLKKNPSETSKEELLLFCQANDICITADGHMILYKYVSEKFKDCYTKTFDNHPGQVVQMPRDEVNSNRSVTCSHGLHVCAWHYLKNTTSGSRIVECMVDPADVVSIPNDYNNSKMRCCKYTVIREITKSGIPMPEDVEASSKELDAYVTEKNVNQKKIYDICKLKRGSKGRVLIPAAFIQKLKKGMKQAFLRIEDRKIFIGSKKTELAYTIDEHYNIRVSATLLKEAGLDKFKNFVIEFNGKEIELKGAKQ